MTLPDPRGWPGAASRWVVGGVPAFLIGLASATGFAPLDLWPVTVIAFAAWMWLVSHAPTRGRALAVGWWFGLGHFTLGLNWIATAFYYQDAMPHWLGWVAVLLLAIYLAVFPALAAGLAWRWGRGRPLAFVLIFAAAWIVTEWLRATLFTGFAWNPLGVVGIHILPLAAAARWIGTYGLSGLIMLAAGTLLLLWIDRRRAVAAAGLVIVVPLFAAGAAWIGGVQDGDAARPLIRIVQPNIGQQDKWKKNAARTNFQRLAGLTGRPGAEPRLILWPEAAVPEFLEENDREDRDARRRLAGLMGPRDLLLTGGVAIEWDKRGYAIGARNSLFLLAPGARILARYDKSHLVPYGEYLPARPILSAIGLSRLAPGDLDFWPGPGPRSYDLPGFGRVGVQICYEVIFSGQVIDPRHRPDFLFNPSNDAWFGPSGPPQHLAQARLRAVEEGLPVVRATPTGISAVVDADGRLIESLPWRTAGAIETRLPAPHAPTLFARFGNVLPLLFAALLAALAIASRRKPR